jgi:hypothetical protein
MTETRRIETAPDFVPTKAVDMIRANLRDSKAREARLRSLLVEALEAMENYGRRGGAEERIAQRIRQQLSPDTELLARYGVDTE